MNERSHSDVTRAIKTIGESLRTSRRYLLGCSQEEMARRIGVSRNTYLRMEAGDPHIQIGYWLRAWRRLYRNPADYITFLDALVSSVDPKEPIALAQAEHSEKGGPLHLDAAFDYETQLERALSAADASPINPPAEDDGGVDLGGLIGGPLDCPPDRNAPEDQS